MLLGAISFSDNIEVGPLVEQLTASTLRGTALTAHKLHADRHFVCVAVKGPGTTATRANDATDRDVVCISGNIPWREQRLEEWLKQGQVPVEQVCRSLPGHWAGLRYRPQDRVLELFNDRLGIGWTFVARLPWGYVFGPDFGAVAKHTAGTAGPDYRHMLVTLGLGYALDESTCFEHIRMLPAAAVLRCTPGEESLTTAREQYRASAHADVRQRRQKLAEALDDAADTWVQPALADLDISLSAGLDCRYGLGLMLEAGRTPDGYTFGHRHSGEVSRAKAIARAAGMHTEVFEVPDSRWDGWRRCVASSGAVGGFHWPDWTAWLNFLQERTSQVLIGFLGDAFSGKHLARANGDSLQEHADAWTVANADADWLSSELLTQRARKDAPDVMGEQLLRLARSADYEQNHQVQLHLDWFGRQRRFTGAQPNLMQSYVKVVPFLYTPVMMDYWQQAPLSDLEQQRLYKEYAAERFPELFTGATERPSLVQRLKGSARNALAGLGPRWKQRFAAPVLDPVKMLVEQKPNIQQLLQQTEPQLSAVLDYGRLREAVRVFPDSTHISAMQLRRVVNLALLLQTAAETPARQAAAAQARAVAGRIGGS